MKENIKALLDLDLLIGNFIYYLVYFKKGDRFTLDDIAEYAIQFNKEIRKIGYNTNRGINVFEIEDFIDYYPIIKRYYVKDKGLEYYVYYLTEVLTPAMLRRYFRVGLSVKLLHTLDEMSEKYFNNFVPLIGYMRE